MEAYFIIANSDGGLKKFKLSNEEFIIIGRSPELAQVVLDDDLCSSKHCKVTMVHNAVTVEDLNSKNGVFLNGIRIIKQNLYISDKVKIGNNLLYIHAEKLGAIDTNLLTYQDSEEKRKFELTLEIEKPKLSNHIHGRKKNSSKAYTKTNDDLESFLSRINIKRSAIIVIIFLCLLVFIFKS